MEDYLWNIPIPEEPYVDLARAGQSDLLNLALQVCACSKRQKDNKLYLTWYIKQ